MRQLATQESGADTPLDEAIAAYLTACSVEGKTDRTLQAYAETLGRLRAIATREGLPAEVAAFRATDVYTFLKAIADSGVSLGTRHRRFRETRAFFSWCTRMDLCVQNPFTGIPNVKVEQKIIQPLTEAEIGALLAICDASTEFGCRNRAIILLFLDTGIRYTELHRLTLDDLAWDARRIHIRHGKGRKQRVVPFGEGPEAALRAVLGWLPRLGRGSALPDRGSPAAAARAHESLPAGDALHPPRPAGGGARQPPPLPAHLCHLGDREPGPRARRPVPAGAFQLGDGASLLGHLRRGQGSGRPCRLQSSSTPVRERGRGRLTPCFPSRGSMPAIR